MTAKVKTGDVMKALQAKYAGKADGPVWSGGLYLEECGINGNGTQSRCDALYAGFTSASGRTLIGHEVKVLRSDWLAELAKIGKADFWFDNTHQWYVVAPPNIVLPAELPEDWGLMLLYGTQLRIAKRAPVRDVTPSWTATRSMLSRMETIRAGSYHQGEAAAASRYYEQQQREAREQVGKTVTTAVRPDLEKFTAVMDEVTRRLRSDSVFDVVDTEDLIEALVDITTVKEMRRRMHNQLTQLAQEVERTAARVAEGFRASWGPMGRLIEEAHRGQA